MFSEIGSELEQTVKDGGERGQGGRGEREGVLDKDAEEKAENMLIILVKTHDIFVS